MKRKNMIICHLSKNSSFYIGCQIAYFSYFYGRILAIVFKISFWTSEPKAITDLTLKPILNLVRSPEWSKDKIELLFLKSVNCTTVQATRVLLYNEYGYEICLYYYTKVNISILLWYIHFYTNLWNLAVGILFPRSIK